MVGPATHGIAGQGVGRMAGAGEGLSLSGGTYLVCSRSRPHHARRGRLDARARCPRALGRIDGRVAGVTKGAAPRTALPPSSSHERTLPAARASLPEYRDYCSVDAVTLLASALP